MFKTEVIDPAYNTLRKQPNDSKKKKRKNNSHNEKEPVDTEPILLNDPLEILKEMRFGNVGHGLVLDKKI